MSQAFILQLGETKAEKLLKGFVMTDREAGKEIIKNHGTGIFSMWWYIQSLCFGKDKVTAFPNKETMAEDLGVSKETVQRWLRKLEEIKAIKRVTAYNQRGSQTSNLLISNASFPIVPEGWEDAYQFGAYKIRHGEYIPLESTEDKPWLIMNTLIKQLKEKQDEDVDALENGGVQICTGHKNRVSKSEQGGCSDLNRGGSPLNPVITRDESTFFEGEEEELNKNYYYDDDIRNYSSDNADKKRRGFSFYNWLDE